MRAGRRSGRRWRLRDDRRARASPGRTRGGAATTVATHMRVRSAALLDAEEGGSSVSAAGGVELSTTEEKMRSPHRTLLPPPPHPWPRSTSAASCSSLAGPSQLSWCADSCAGEDQCRNSLQISTPPQVSDEDKHPTVLPLVSQDRRTLALIRERYSIGRMRTVRKSQRSNTSRNFLVSYGRFPIRIDLGFLLIRVMAAGVWCGSTRTR
jgi:hypothetical protein